MEIWHITVIAVCSGLLLRRFREDAAESESPGTPFRPRSLRSLRRELGEAVPEEVPLAPPEPDPTEGLDPVFDQVRELVESARQEINHAQIHARSLLLNAQAEAEATLERAREEVLQALQDPSPESLEPGSDLLAQVQERGIRQGRRDGLENSRSVALKDAERIFNQLESLIDS